MDSPSSKASKSGQALLVNGVSVAWDETAREVSVRQVLSNGGLRERSEQSAADNGPRSSLSPFEPHARCRRAVPRCIHEGLVAFSEVREALFRPKLVRA